MQIIEDTFRTDAFARTEFSKTGKGRNLRRVGQCGEIKSLLRAEEIAKKVKELSKW